jgi:cytochrome c oxidase assembly protein subunit 11
MKFSADWRMLGKLCVVVIAMFGFGWAMIPIYSTICKLTGINELTRIDKGAAEFARNTQIDTSRKVTVEFDANSRGPWRFKAEKTSLDVHPGELVTVVYQVINTENREVSGQAIPSYAPQHSAGYFRKLECFCFQKQILEANQTRSFPVVFVIDPKLPADVATITLSYTFFEYGAKPLQGAISAPVTARSGG